MIFSFWIYMMVGLIVVIIAVAFILRIICLKRHKKTGKKYNTNTKIINIADQSAIQKNSGVQIDNTEITEGIREKQVHADCNQVENGNQNNTAFNTKREVLVEQDITFIHTDESIN